MLMFLPILTINLTSFKLIIAKWDPASTNVLVAHWGRARMDAIS